LCIIIYAQRRRRKAQHTLRGDVAEKFSRIKDFLGLEQDTEAIRSLITWYYSQHEKELSGPPKTMWHINLNLEGVLVWDPIAHQAVQIKFSPKGITCVYDDSSERKHIQFALSKPDIQEVIRQRRKEGWKLPDV
jgi:hypothetical protein